MTGNVYSTPETTDNGSEWWTTPALELEPAGSGSNGACGTDKPSRLGPGSVGVVESDLAGTAKSGSSGVSSKLRSRATADSDVEEPDSEFIVVEAGSNGVAGGVNSLRTGLVGADESDLAEAPGSGSNVVGVVESGSPSLVAGATGSSSRCNVGRGADESSQSGAADVPVRESEVVNTEFTEIYKMVSSIL